MRLWAVVALTLASLLPECAASVAFPTDLLQFTLPEYSQGIEVTSIPAAVDSGGGQLNYSLSGSLSNNVSAVWFEWSRVWHR